MVDEEDPVGLFSVVKIKRHSEGWWERIIETTGRPYKNAIIMRDRYNSRNIDDGIWWVVMSDAGAVKAVEKNAKRIADLERVNMKIANIRRNG